MRITLRLCALFVIAIFLFPAAAQAAPQEPEADPFVPRPPLFALDGQSGDALGTAVALSPDGATLLAGAPRADKGTVVDQGAAYVYTRTGATWKYQARLPAGDAPAYGRLGQSVALAPNLAAAGANEAVYLFTRSGATWKLQKTLDGPPGELFGAAVALSPDGSTLIVGAYLANGPNGEGQGAAYIYVRDGANWTQQGRLTAANGKPGDNFGAAVAVAGDLAIVGAAEATVGADGYEGVAYVFARSGTTWAQQAKLQATGGQPGDAFGRSVAILPVAGGPALAAVGAPYSGGAGAAYVFNQSGTSWSQAARLVMPGAKPGDTLGRSIALTGGPAPMVLAGAPGREGERGAAAVFSREAGGWTAIRTLSAADGAPGEHFGWSVALAESAAAAGAPEAAVGGSSAGQGQAYPFIRGRAPFGAFVPLAVR